MIRGLRFIVLFTALIFLSSCAFRRATSLKKNGKEKLEVSSGNESIEKSLRFSDNKEKNKTGVYLLENGCQSLLARLWLFDHAQKSIDIQYYSFSHDLTSLIASDRILRAADRGVKVRILVDDAASKMNSHEIRLMDSHENIELRVYNAGLRLGSLDKRVKHLTKNYNRLLRRMHNKTLSVDGEASIIGGRNIADRYFDYEKKYNFRDRDVLLLGKSVKDVTASFDEFWNDELTVPYEKLSSRLDNRRYTKANRFDRLHKFAEYTTEFSTTMRERVKNFPGDLKAAEKSGELFWVKEAVFVSDRPGKNEERERRVGGATTDTLAELIRKAKFSIEMQSPYFITTPGSEQLIKETIGRGVKIKVLTNSLASTDNHEAFSGYQKERKKLLEAGVEIHEFKPDAKERYELMCDEVQAKINYKAVYGFHSKTILIDSSVAVVGSYNFDPRSANYNTECIIVLRSKEAVRNLRKYFEKGFKEENSWKITKDWNPDKEAGLRQRWKVMTRWVVPKSLL